MTSDRRSEVRGPRARASLITGSRDEGPALAVTAPLSGPDFGLAAVGPDNTVEGFGDVEDSPTGGRGLAPAQLAHPNPSAKAGDRLPYSPSPGFPTQNPRLRPFDKLKATSGMPNSELPTSPFRQAQGYVGQADLCEYQCLLLPTSLS